MEEEFEVRFDRGEVVGGDGGGRPEEGVVVGEEGEEDAEEEGGCYCEMGGKEGG